MNTLETQTNAAGGQSVLTDVLGLWPQRRKISMQQQQLDIGTTAIDLSKFVTFEPATFTQRYKVMGARRLEGDLVGVIRLTHSSGYEVLLRDESGKVTSHSPHSLFPLPPSEA